MKTMKVFSTLLLVLVIFSCSQQEIVPSTASQNRLALNDERVLILVDGKQVSGSALQAIDPTTISSIDVIKNMEEIRKYTPKNYEGVVKINLKK